MEDHLKNITKIWISLGVNPGGKSPQEGGWFTLGKSDDLIRMMTGGTPIFSQTSRFSEVLQNFPNSQRIQVGHMVTIRRKNQATSPPAFAAVGRPANQIPAKDNEHVHVVYKATTM